MDLAEQSPTSSAADVNKLSCAIHPIPKNLQEQLPCSPHDAYVESVERRKTIRIGHDPIALGLKGYGDRGEDRPR
jgi:hypothetical protein